MLTLISYGTKHGTPPETDMAFSAKHLGNPYWKNEMRALTGLDNEVAQYVMASPQFCMLLTTIAICAIEWEKMFRVVYNTTNSKVTIGVYCTGGRHRSVTVVERLKDYLVAKGYEVKVEHRDINKE